MNKILFLFTVAITVKSVDSTGTNRYATSLKRLQCNIHQGSSTLLTKQFQAYHWRENQMFLWGVTECWPIKGPTKRLDKRFSQQHPYFSALKLRDDFHTISTVFHLNDISIAALKDEYEYDPWHKVQLAIDLLHRSWKYLYIPVQSICITECLIGMKNKTVYSQHTPSKRYCCFWLKFKLGKGNTGYFFFIQKCTVENIFLTNMTFMGWHKMVMYLVDGWWFFHMGYLYTDNCYTKEKKVTSMPVPSR
jgi:hypothetical protein